MLVLAPAASRPPTNHPTNHCVQANVMELGRKLAQSLGVGSSKDMALVAEISKLLLHSMQFAMAEGGKRVRAPTMMGLG